MTSSVVIIGPAACGKTRNAEALRRFYGMKSILDDAHLGTKIPAKDVLVLGVFRPTNAPVGVRIISYADAARAAGLLGSDAES